MAKKKTPQGITEPPAPVRRRAAAKRVASAASNDTTTTPAAMASAPANGGRREPTQAEIAEAAYYRHLNRGGTAGDEFSDWIEAERELKDRR
jgi:hypothetical protein